MANNKRGKRGGSQFNRELKKTVQSMLDTGSTSGVVAEGNTKGYSPAMFQCFDGEETHEDFLVPRRSLTVKQLLESRPLKMEFEDRNGKQLDKISKRLVATSDRRLVWKSDRTLLRQNKPDNPYGYSGLKRQTSRSKRIIPDQKVLEPLSGKSEINISGKSDVEDDI